jgi:hypothetical protein
MDTGAIKRARSNTDCSAVPAGWDLAAEYTLPPKQFEIISRHRPAFKLSGNHTWQFHRQSCLLKSHRSLFGKHRCQSNSHRCQPNSHRCQSNSHRCQSNSHRCQPNSHRCQPNSHRCLCAEADLPKNRQVVAVRRQTCLKTDRWWLCGGRPACGKPGLAVYKQTCLKTGRWCLWGGRPA